MKIKNSTVHLVSFEDYLSLQAEMVIYWRGRGVGSHYRYDTTEKNGLFCSDFSEAWPKGFTTPKGFFFSGQC